MRLAPTLACGWVLVGASCSASTLPEVPPTPPGHTSQRTEVRSNVEDGAPSEHDRIDAESEADVDDDVEIDADAALARIRQSIDHCGPDTIAKVNRWLVVVEIEDNVERFEETDVNGALQLRLQAWTAGNGIGAATRTLHMQLTPARCQGVASIIENSNDTPFVAWFSAETLAKGRPDEAKILMDTMGVEVFQFAPKKDPSHLFHAARGMPKRDLSKEGAGDDFESEVSEESPSKRRPDVGNLYVEKSQSKTRWVEGPTPASIPSVIRVVKPGRGWLSYGTTKPMPAPYVTGDYDVITLESHSRWGTATLLVRDRPGKRYRFVGTGGGFFGLPTWESRHGQMLVGVMKTKGHPRVPNLVPVVFDLERGILYAVSTDPSEFFVDGVEASAECDPIPVSTSGRWTAPAEDDEMPCRHHVFNDEAITQIDCPWPEADETHVECVATEFALERLFKWIRRHR